jgi:hypothetical protein
MDKREVFSFEGWSSEIGQKTKELQAQLYFMDQQRKLPSVLRRPAAELHRLLVREVPDLTKEFSTRKELASPNAWVAVPLNYPRFKSPAERPTIERWIGEPESWRDALAGFLAWSDSAMPQIPQYRVAPPWASAIGKTDPLGMDVVFDDRYFMASSELNLLNTLLLAEEENG